MRGLQKDDIIQLERKGFFRVDAPYSGGDLPMVLFAIPDSKPRATGVAAEWAAKEKATAAATPTTKKK
jgi:glutamyl-tRNA synthetase